EGVGLAAPVPELLVEGLCPPGCPYRRTMVTDRGEYLCEDVQCVRLAELVAELLVQDAGLLSGDGRAMEVTERTRGTGERFVNVGLTAPVAKTLVQIEGPLG